MTRMDVLGLDRPTGLPVICQNAGPAGGGANLYKVLDCQDQLIAKMFPAEVGRLRVEREVTNTLRARSMGLSAPDIRALVEEGESLGFVYVKVSGSTYLERICDDIERLDYWAERYAFIHRAIHEREVDDMGPIKDVLEEKIHRADLEDRLKEKMLGRLRSLPDGACICHGDFHPGNVIVTGDDFVTIDWAGASRGHCLADVALTSVLLDVWLPFKVRELDVRINRRSLEFFHRTYLDAYLILSGESREDLEEWRAPVAAARLSEGNPWERDRLLEIIGEG